MPDTDGNRRPPTLAAPARPRVRLTLYLVPILTVFTVGQLTRAVWPTMLEHAPETILVATSAITRLLLVQPVVPAVVFFAIGIVRIVLLAPLYWSFGREYGDTALRWSEEQLGASPVWFGRFERGFRKAGRPLVLCWWSPLVAVMAGVIGMRGRVFFPLVVVGAVARVSAIYFVGDWFEGPLTEISSFISRYALYLTPITIAITVFQLLASRRRGTGPTIGTLEHLEEDFAATEAEVASEATVVSPPEVD